MLALVVLFALVAAALGVLAVVLPRRARAAQARAEVLLASRREVTPVPPLSSFVVEALSQGVVAVDAGGRVVLLNPAARAMNVVDVDRLSFPELAELADRARASGERRSRVVDLPIGRLGREPIALSVVAVPLVGDEERDDGPAVAVLLTDMSEQRRLEAVRRDFVANVSHELKTPVGAIGVLAEAIQDAAGDPEAVARFAGRMQHEATRLGRLVRDLMELSRVQGADPMPGTAEVDMRSVVNEAVDRARLAAELKSIELRVRCSSDELVVRGDETQLTTAVSNLVDNAIAYSPQDTRVLVSAVAAVDAQARPVVEISIGDQGFGIVEADLERIFERFYRVDPARSRATGGTGLGLAIVRNVVTNHLGEIAVQSTPGTGSTFTVRLPRVHPRAASSAPPRAVAPATAGRAAEGRA